LDLTIIVSARQDTAPEPGMPGPFDLIAGRPILKFVLNAAQSLKPSALVVAGPDNVSMHKAIGDESLLVALSGDLSAGQVLKEAQPAAAGRSATILVLPWDYPFVSTGTLREMIDHHHTEKAAMTLMDTAAGSHSLPAGVVVFRDDWLWPNLHPDPSAEGGSSFLSSLAAAAREQAQRVAAWAVFHPMEATALDDQVKLAQARTEMQLRINEGWLRSGVTILHPNATYIDADVEIGAGTIIWPNTFIQGDSRIGRACTIGPSTIIRGSTIGDQCRVEMSVVEQATMEEGSDVGPFGHLRKGAHLGPGAHMGNFGEVKNSYLGPGAKMGHFSYLGDATVGAEANIGAGTITCNYDGQHKHSTTIGKEAFVGSGSMLVAPVEIGDGATTGAGSVVTHDVPPGHIAYGVPARTQPTPNAKEPEAD
jgi:bifunctional UDP-N-acetylglucosamine pyrophosphorylase/glucosamine-1-phosphate N-acetyltransferase